MNDKEICGKCEQARVLCDCDAYCETCGKHQERCQCAGYEEEIDDDDDE